MDSPFHDHVLVPLFADDVELAKWRAVRSWPLFDKMEITNSGQYLGNELQSTNASVNENVQYLPDDGDEWQVPARTLQTQTGDCEDLAILKYSVLMALGVPEDKLMLVLGKVTTPIERDHAFLIADGKVLDSRFNKLINPDNYLNFIPMKAFSGMDGFLVAKQIVIDQVISKQV